jgi:hypothetical protein
MRLTNPLNAVPGPNSMKRAEPSCASKYRIESSQRTGDTTCSVRSRRISPAPPCGRAVTLEITGTDGGAQRHRIQHGSHFRLRASHQTRMVGSRHRKPHRPLGPFFLGKGARLLDLPGLT